MCLRRRVAGFSLGSQPVNWSGSLDGYSYFGAENSRGCQLVTPAAGIPPDPAFLERAAGSHCGASEKLEQQ